MASHGDDTDTKPMQAVAPRGLIDDDRPTEVYDPQMRRDLHTSRRQVLRGSTVQEILRNDEHHLSRTLGRLLDRARRDLATAEIDERAVLTLDHEFEFDTRVGYKLHIVLYDPQDRCVEVTAEVDPDGREIRRGSLIARMVSI